MATHTIRKSSHAGIGYSVVDLNDVRHVFAAAVPRRGLTLRQQADDALRTIEAVIQEEGTRGSIVHQAVFVPNVNLIDECRQIIRDFYGERDAGHQLHPPAPVRRQAAGDRGPGHRPRHGRGPDRAASASNWSSPGTTTSPGAIVRRSFPRTATAASTTPPWTPSSRFARCWPASTSASTR